MLLLYARDGWPHDTTVLSMWPAIRSDTTIIALDRLLETGHRTTQGARTVDGRPLVPISQFGPAIQVDGQVLRVE